MNRINTCCTFLGYSEPSEQALLQQEQRTAPTTASGSRSGFRRGFTAMMSARGGYCRKHH